MPAMTARSELLHERWTTVEGLRVFARVADGVVPHGAIPIVLVHGFGVSGRYMLPTARLLAIRHPVYVPDLPGWGRSEKPPRVQTIAELADFLADWMTAIGLDRAAFLGNSFGCQIIVAFALRHPDRIDRAVLVGPMGDPAMRSPVRLLGRLIWDSLRERPREVGIALHDYGRFGLRRGLATLRIMLSDSFEEKARRVAVPALVVRGEQDRIVTRAWAERVAALIPAGRFESVPDAAHAVNFDAPAALTAITNRFLDEPRSAPP
jgi:2-hydroxy-6-oxonona-2,4-dienedioate hydrolase